MATQRPLHIDPATGNPRELVAGDKLGGITGGTATGESMTQDQFGANSTQMLTTGAPVFGQVVVKADAGTGITASRYSTNTGGPNFTLQKARGTMASPSNAAAGDVTFNLLGTGYADGAFRTAVNLQGRLATGFAVGSSPGVWAFQTTPVGSYVQRDVVLFDSAGNIQLVLAGTLNAATVDVVSIVGVDNGAGNREFQVQPESGGYLAYGADVLRRVPVASGSASSSYEERIKRVLTTDATVTTLDTIAIEANFTYLIESRIVARRTGGTAGTANDGAIYSIERKSYTTKAGVVTVLGAGAWSEAEDQPAWDATLTISGTNVLIRVTGAANNNISWQAMTTVNRIGS